MRRKIITQKKTGSRGFTPYLFGRDRKSEGFTLIETLIYIALMAIMIGGGLVGVYNIIEGTERTRGAMHREQEAFFVTRKIDTVLSETIARDTPVNGEDTTLEVTTLDKEGSHDVHIILEDEQIKLLRDGTKSPLHDVAIVAENLTFKHSSVSSTLTARFELDGIPYQLNHFLP